MSRAATIRTVRLADNAPQRAALRDYANRPLHRVMVRSLLDE